MKKILINTLLTLVTLLICYGLLEWASGRLYKKLAPINGQKAISMLTKQSWDSFDDWQTVSEIEVFPYYLYRNKAFSKIDGVQQVNSEGYRNGEKEFGEKEKGKIRIITIGGSTTYGWLIKDYRKTWSAQLEEILNKEFDGKVEVINAGLPSGLSAEALVAFVMKDKYLQPDIVIFHNGGNDAVPLFYDSYTPDYRFHRSVGSGDSLRPGEAKLIKNSNLAKLIYAFWLKKVTVSTIKQEPDEEMSLKKALANAEKHYPLGFERNMETMIREAKDIGAIPVLFPFHLIEDNAKQAHVLQKALRLGLNKDKDVLKALAKKYNLSYNEMPQDQVPLEYFSDHCHLQAEGDRIKAEFISGPVAQIIKSQLNK